MLLHATLLVCVACSSNTPSASPSQDTPTGSAPVTVSATPASSPISIVDAVPAAPHLARVTRIAAMRDGGYVVKLALSSRGVMLGVAHPRPSPDAQALDLQPSQLELIGSHSSVSIADVGEDGDRQAGGGDIEGGQVAWMETPSTNLFEQPYEIYVADRRGQGQVRVAAEPRPIPPPPGGVRPMLAGDRVYWAATEGDVGRPRSMRALVCSAAVSGRGGTRVEVRDVMLPSASGEYLAYARTGLIDKALPDRRVEIHLRHLPSGDDRIVSAFELGRGQELGDLASHGESVSWVVSTEKGAASEDPPSPGGSLLSIAGPGEELLTVQGEGEHFLQTDMSNSLVAWVDGTSGGRQWVLDRSTETVLELDPAPGLKSVAVAGDRVIWRASEKTWKTARVVP